MQARLRSHLNTSSFLFHFSFSSSFSQTLDPTRASQCSECVGESTAIQRREVKCILSNGTELELSQCNNATKPTDHRECVNQDCKGVWAPGSWTEVSGSGLRAQRTPSCRQVSMVDARPLRSRHSSFNPFTFYLLPPSVVANAARKAFKAESCSASGRVDRRPPESRRARRARTCPGRSSCELVIFPVPLVSLGSSLPTGSHAFPLSRLAFLATASDSCIYSYIR